MTETFDDFDYGQPRAEIRREIGLALEAQREYDAWRRENDDLDDDLLEQTRTAHRAELDPLPWAEGLAKWATLARKDRGEPEPTSVGDWLRQQPRQQKGPRTLITDEADRKLIKGSLEHGSTATPAPEDDDADKGPKTLGDYLRADHEQRRGKVRR